jgi:beta-lactamase regulating signal transducer with metallopeptidase domain
MTLNASWLTPDVTRNAALTILKFFWQGAALAAIAYASMALTRRATVRYAIGVAVLALMLVVPVLTFLDLQPQAQNAAASSFTLAKQVSASNSLPLGRLGLATRWSQRHSRQPSPTPADYLSWLVYSWFAGVVLLSLRPAVGFLALRRLHRRESVPVSARLRERCRLLEQRLGIRRLIRYCETVRLEAPAVAGFFRPVVFLPLSALTGLSADQLDAVIAHELAHIYRLDAFVNLFQIAAETLLFFHPAVWWLNQRIRSERENCCDDVAIAVCGNAAAYATALASMAEWQAAPSMAMAANRHPLAARVARILGIAKTQGELRGSSLAASALCLAVSLAAGHALFGASQPQQAPAAKASAVHGDASDGAMVISPSRHAASPAPGSAPSVAQAPVTGSEPSDANAPQAASPALAEGASEIDQAPEQETPAEKAHVPPSPSEPHSSYIADLQAAGLDNLSVDEILALKMQGVTADYIRSIRALGLQADAEDFVALKVQGVTPEYIQGLRELGLKTDTNGVIAMKVQGVTPEYVHELRGAFLGIDSGNVVAMKIQGVGPEYIQKLRDFSGLQLDIDAVIAMKVQGIGPEYIKSMRDITGLKLDTDDVIAMTVQGISPDYVREMKALGLSADAGDLVGMKVQGITPEYVKSLQAAGLKLDAGELIGAKVQGITPEFIDRVRKHGFEHLDLGKLIQLKVTGVLDE